MRQISWLLLGIPLLVQAQNRDSVKFEKVSSWEEVLSAARNQNKYIFVDCFATWCAPCKAMEQEVYDKNQVASFMNDKFISIQIQMDSTDHDDSSTKKWLWEARTIASDFNIQSYPTYLFFTPSGEIVHKGHGYKSYGDFISLAKNALDTNSQYYTLIRKYRSGFLDFPSMAKLAYMAKDMRDMDLANKVGHDYLFQNLYKLCDSELLAKENIEFITNFIKSSNERGFDFFYRHRRQIDSVMNGTLYVTSFSQYVIDFIISVEEVYSNLFKNLDTYHLEFKNPVENPNWKRMSGAIKRKYNDECAKRIILDAKLKWYEYAKCWPEYCKTVVIKVKKYGPYGLFSADSKLNQNAFDIFLHSNNKKYLNLALRWSNNSIKMSKENVNPEYYDTYANLLYKLGRKREAIYYEEKAASLALNARDIQENLNKMRQNKPTWPSN